MSNVADVIGHCIAMVVTNKSSSIKSNTAERLGLAWFGFPGNPKNV